MYIQAHLSYRHSHIHAIGANILCASSNDYQMQNIGFNGDSANEKSQ